MYIVSLIYVCDISEIEAALEDHRAYLKKHYDSGHFLASGRMVPRTGGVILVKADSREELDAILDQDPFYQKKLVNYDIQEWVPNMTAPGLEGLM